MARTPHLFWPKSRTQVEHPRGPKSAKERTGGSALRAKAGAQELGLSARRACTLFPVARSTLKYRSRKTTTSTLIFLLLVMPGPAWTTELRWEGSALDG